MQFNLFENVFHNYVGSWGARRCKLAWTWGIHKGEKYSYYWTWKIWDWDLVLFSLSTRIQWLFEVVFLWVLSQLHEAQRAASKAYGESIDNWISNYMCLTLIVVWILIILWFWLWFLLHPILLFHLQLQFWLQRESVILSILLVMRYIEVVHSQCLRWLFCH